VTDTREDRRRGGRDRASDSLVIPKTGEITLGAPPRTRQIFDAVFVE